MSQHPFQNFVVHFRSGEQVFAEGDSGTTMFVVQSGRVELFRQVNDHKQSVGVMEKGDFFGEMSILEGLPRTLSAETLEDADLVEINSTIFDKMIRGNIEIGIRMLRKLSIRLREADIKLAEVQATGTTASASRSTQVATGRPKKSTDTGVRLEAEGQGAFPLCDDETIIGRYDPVTELRPDIDLTDLDLKRSVSRRHARVLRVDDGYVVVEEVGALNGTFVNDAELTAGQRHVIVAGDQLRLGTVALVFRS